MKITIIYDNEIFKKGFGLISDWGFSCLIETEYDTILFDTGANGEILLNNMNLLDINPEDIKKIIISHEHGDHKGGLKSLIPYLKDIELYHLNNENTFKKIISIIPEKPTKISNNIWTTGRLNGFVDEQSLILKYNNCYYVLTGCSHPGMKKILNTADQIGNITGIIGGFHDFKDLYLFNNFNFICPCHCTSNKQILKKRFPNTTCNCGVGKIIDFKVKT